MGTIVEDKNAEDRKTQLGDEDDEVKFVTGNYFKNGFNDGDIE